MVSVRPAALADIPAMVEMGRAMHAESPRYARLTFSPDKVAALIRGTVTGTLVTAPPGGVVVAEKNGKLIGMMGGYTFEPFFSHDKIATDYALYVKPEHRKLCRAAVLLIRAFEAWAIAQEDVRDIVPGVSTMIDAEGTRRFYEKLGYEHYGHSMIKRIR